MSHHFLQVHREIVHGHGIQLAPSGPQALKMHLSVGLGRLGFARSKFCGLCAHASVGPSILVSSILRPILASADHDRLRKPLHAFLAGR